MTEVFADTQYFVAMMDRRDPWSDVAEAVAATITDAVLVTTADVLVEMLGFVSGSGSRLRRLAVDTARSVRIHPRIVVVEQSSDLFQRGLDLYAARPDKGYSLVDCISMVTMRDRGITEILTADRHFFQEGFTVLMRP